MRAYDIELSLQDLRHLIWSESSVSSETGGSFLKSSYGEGTGKLYYKLSCYDSYRGIFGHECVNELIAARLMDLMGIEHLRYSLIHALITVDSREEETWLSCSRSYRHSTDRKQALDFFYRFNKQDNESPLDLCDRMGWGLKVRQMMLVDYLICNRDRHGANIEILRGQDGTLRMAPLFDNGLSFLFSSYGDSKRIAAFDPLEDIAANNFLGTRSLEENLAFVKGWDLGIAPLMPAWKESLFAGLSTVLPEEHREAIWRMICLRWERIEELL